MTDIEKNKKYIVFTDGSSSVQKDDKNIRYGGIGIFFPISKEEISIPFDGEDITNQRMELSACIIAIKYFIKKMKNQKIMWELDIYSDSKYTIDCITRWAPRWILSGWNKKLSGGKILNLDLIKELYILSKLYPINYYHVRSHKREPQKDTLEWNLWFGNKKADELAGKAKDSIELKHQLLGQNIINNLEQDVTEDFDIDIEILKDLEYIETINKL